MQLRKVVAYITRRGVDGEELLVFDHRDYPEAGTQVPAGTAQDGEQIEDTLRREVEEETGLSDCRVVAKLGVYDWVHPISGNVHERHVFHMRAPEETQDEWMWVETSGGEVPDDEGYVFLFRWVTFHAEIQLAVDQGDYLDTIRGQGSGPFEA